MSTTDQCEVTWEQRVESFSFKEEQVQSLIKDSEKGLVGAEITDFLQENNHNIVILFPF